MRKLSATEKERGAIWNDYLEARREDLSEEDFVFVSGIDVVAGRGAGLLRLVLERRDIQEDLAKSVVPDRIDS